MLLKSRSITITAFLVLLLSLLDANKSFAQLTAGYAAADLYVAYIGSGPGNLKYRVNLVIYTICQPSTSSVPAKKEAVQITTSGSCYGGRFIDISLTPGATDTVDQLCPSYSSLNSCNSASSIYPGYTVTTYTDTVSLPKACTDWLFIWNSTNSRTSNDDLYPVPG